MKPLSICMPSQVPDTLNPETATFNRNILEQIHFEKNSPPRLKAHRLTAINYEVYMWDH